MTKEEALVLIEEQREQDLSKFEIPKCYSGPTYMPDGSRFYTYCGSTISIDGKECTETDWVNVPFRGSHLRERAWPLPRRCVGCGIAENDSFKHITYVGHNHDFQRNC
jgi:hypothetical protein